MYMPAIGYWLLPSYLCIWMGHHCSRFISDTILLWEFLIGHSFQGSVRGNYFLIDPIVWCDFLIDPIVWCDSGDFSGIVVAHYLQSLSPALVLGGELVYHRRPGEEGTVTSLVGRYSGKHAQVTCHTQSSKRVLSSEASTQCSGGTGFRQEFCPWEWNPLHSTLPFMYRNSNSAVGVGSFSSLWFWGVGEPRPSL